MKFVMTQAVCPEGMQLLDGIADVYVADNQDPNNYLDEMRDAAALIVRIAKCDAFASHFAILTIRAAASLISSR